MDYKKINYLHLVPKMPSTTFHLHDGCEIYYLISGDVKYFVEKQIYDVNPGDVFITNPTEIHKPNFESDKRYERITLCFDPAFYSQFSTAEFDLLDCFFNRENGTKNKISLTGFELDKLMEIFKRIEELESNKPDYYDIKINTLIIDLLILLNEAAIKNRYSKPKNQLYGNMLEIMSYIDENLDGDLSLSALEKRFYMSQAHLCRSFKEQTNSTIHNYIVKKRIALAKKLLATDISVTQTMEMCGFGDFSNFIKAFKKNTGMTPRSFKQLMTK